MPTLRRPWCKEGYFHLFGHQPGFRGRQPHGRQQRPFGVRRMQRRQLRLLRALTAIPVFAKEGRWGRPSFILPVSSATSAVALASFVDQYLVHPHIVFQVRLAFRGRNTHDELVAAPHGKLAHLGESDHLDRSRGKALDAHRLAQQLRDRRAPVHIPQLRRHEHAVLGLQPTVADGNDQADTPRAEDLRGV